MRGRRRVRRPAVGSTVGPAGSGVHLTGSRHFRVATNRTNRMWVPCLPVSPPEGEDARIGFGAVDDDGVDSRPAIRDGRQSHCVGARLGFPKECPAVLPGPRTRGDPWKAVRVASRGPPRPTGNPAVSSWSPPKRRSRRRCGKRPPIPLTRAPEGATCQRCRRLRTNAEPSVEGSRGKAPKGRPEGAGSGAVQPRWGSVQERSRRHSPKAAPKEESRRIRLRLDSSFTSTRSVWHPAARRTRRIG